ncbi:MAG: ABC transporter substrate-binding protein [Dehalococcoidales bacterium]|nr:ABC transporter substrate-binding protein [Dehalococcoidales bacterium]
MTEGIKSRRMTRRQFIGAGLVGGAMVLAGCAAPQPAASPTKPAAAQPTQASAPTKAPAQAPAQAPTQAPAAATASAPTGKPKDVPRNRTLITMWMTGAREGRWVDSELWSPYVVGGNHQNGLGQFYEPLAYYSAFADKEYMWLAESYKYSADYKELTIKTRPGVKWSDGVDFSAEDVAFTLTSLKELGGKVKWGVDVAQFVDDAQATDKNTVVVKFKVPSPRFFWFMTYKYDIGVHPVPKHIFQGQDWTSFTHGDISKGMPVTTCPYKLVFASPEQKIMDLRDEWWAAKTGLAKMPRVQRQIWLPFTGEQQLAQQLITNQLDYTQSLTVDTMLTVFKQNPKVTTHSGKNSPYGYMDWWPHSMYINTSKAPFGDKDVRWALSNFIDRQQIIDVSWAGAAEKSPIVMPYYPPLRPYIDSIKDITAKYDTLEFNPTKGAALLTAKGWKKDGQGFWVDSNGQRLKMEIISFGATGNAVLPVLSELLKRQGVDASFGLPPDFDDQFQQGTYTSAVYGHGGSVRDPYYTLRLYQSATVAVPGAHLANFTKWKNADYDKIVDEVFVTDMSDKTKLMDLFHKAMEIWIPELPDIPLTYNYHRIPMNETYWTNWPTEKNAYINGAFWHMTYPLVLWNLEPTQ